MTYSIKRSLSRQEKIKIRKLDKEIDILLDRVEVLRNSKIVPRNKLKSLGKEIKEKFLEIIKIKNGYQT
jgi:hypothetical protein